MKKVLITLLAGLLLSAGPLLAQDDAAEAPAKPWTKGGLGSVTYNQVGLFNWAAGGQSNMTLIGNLGLFANKKKENYSWETTLDLAYGFIKNNFIFDPQSPINKAEDKIDLNSKYGRKAWNEKVFYTGLFNFRTQFDYGRQNPGENVYISRFLSPAYFVFALGLDYKPSDDFSLFFSPASGKVTIVADDSLASQGAFGVNQLLNEENPAEGFRPGNGASARIEVGATFRAKFKKAVSKNLSLESNLELFSNYIDRPQNIDVRWNNVLVANITKYFTVNFFTDMIYDHDIKIQIVDSKGAPINSVNPEPILNPLSGAFESNTTFWPGPGYLDGSDLGDVTQVQRKGPRLQFKQILGLGFTYKF